MVVAAERIGQSMHRRDRGIGEGLARQGRAEQHRLARAAILSVRAGGDQVAAEQPQSLPRQRIADRVLLDLAGIGLDGMHHRVDARRRRMGRRQADRELGIEQREVGEELP